LARAVTTTALLSSIGVAAAVAGKADFLFCPVLNGGGDDIGDGSESVLKSREGVCWVWLSQQEQKGVKRGKRKKNHLKNKIKNKHALFKAPKVGVHLLALPPGAAE
jgi:hypothetical protein